MRLAIDYAKSTECGRPHSGGSTVFTAKQRKTFATRNQLLAFSSVQSHRITNVLG